MTCFWVFNREKGLQKILFLKRNIFKDKSHIINKYLLMWPCPYLPLSLVWNRNEIRSWKMLYLQLYFYQALCHLLTVGAQFADILNFHHCIIFCGFSILHLPVPCNMPDEPVYNAIAVDNSLYICTQCTHCYWYCSIWEYRGKDLPDITLAQLRGRT